MSRVQTPHTRQALDKNIVIKLRLIKQKSGDFCEWLTSRDCGLVCPCKRSSSSEIYSCGLRPQEVRHLKTNEVNLQEGTLYITDSKRNKDRIVAMSDDLLKLCLQYNALIKAKLPFRDFFFENPHEGMYSAAWIQQQFFRCWKYADISFAKDFRPRVYDWRYPNFDKIQTFSKKILF